MAELDALRELERQYQRLAHLDRPFFIVLMPGGLHLVKLALGCIPPNIDVVLVLNSTAAWENEWAKTHLKVSGMLKSRLRLAHSAVLDFLFKNVKQPFGVLDYDCFVLDATLFDVIRAVPPDAAMNSYFVYKNPDLALEIPETFFLFFNAGIIERIRSKYQIDSGLYTWDELAVPIKDQLRSIGIDATRYPEPHKRYFDTMRVLLLLCIAEQVPCHFPAEYPALPKPNLTLFHVGAASKRKVDTDIWGLRGSYFSRRILELSADPTLRDGYGKLLGFESAEAILQSFPSARAEIGEAFIRFTEELPGIIPELR